MYFRRTETQFNRPERHGGDRVESAAKKVSVFNHGVRLVGKVNPILFEESLRLKAEWYILNNCGEVDKYRE